MIINNDIKYARDILMLSLMIKKTGMNPLSKSPNNVIAAANLLPLLITFVAPGFIEPKLLGSGKLNNFEVMIAKGTDPIRYNMSDRAIILMGLIFIVSMNMLNIFSNI